MRKKARVVAAMLALGLAGDALAVSKGGTLYVKAKNTRLMASASATAPALEVLQPGQAVKWLGPDAKDKQWHQVEVTLGNKKTLKGVVFQSNLATQPPNMELVASDGGVVRKDANDFAKSVAAVKLLSDGPIEYGNKKGGDMKKAVEDLQALEKLAEAVGPDKLAAHAQKAGLFPVVGPSEQVKVAGGGDK